MGGFSMSPAERALAEKFGVPACLICPESHTVSALIALCDPVFGERALRRGDRIVTFKPLEEEIRSAGFVPTVLPFLPDGKTPDVSLLAEVLTPDTAAVFLSHGKGAHFDVKKARDFCNAFDLWLIEDAGTATGETLSFGGSPLFCGTAGDVGLALSDGKKLILTRDPALAALLRPYFQ